MKNRASPKSVPLLPSLGATTTTTKEQYFSMNKLSKYIAYWMAVLLTWDIVQGAPMQYPVTIGGFAGFAVIQAFTFDSKGGLVVV